MRIKEPSFVKRAAQLSTQFQCKQQDLGGQCPEHEKYKEVFPTCKYLAQLAAEETGERYQTRVAVLLALSKAWEEGRDVEVVELLHQGATSPSSLEQGQHPAQENPELPTSLSDEDEQYEVFQRAPEKPQSDGRNEILQLASDPAEPLETMPANREAHRAHDAGACGTPRQNGGRSAATAKYIALYEQR
ncbi:hypothetical protein HPB48_022370 [Haemaphysalis longicornis]|uniref:Uncharacterized protein n=1 Tax=Haemaphysalis longicornis TaxID=44386 RepID=A0A9J6GZA1_HAELO|nr:hypothetical protein HPB48_022370 [Haemaphysalis longicornis]